MTQEEKELLLKDLCARLPYRVIVETQLVNAPRAKYPVLKVLQSHMLCDFMQTIENVIHKPYLFPLSSMTEEATREFDATLEWITTADGDSEGVMTYDSFDCLNKHHIDYRGFIEKGLAIDATNKNIY